MFNKKKNKPKILVVDDVVDYIEMIQDRLERIGYEVDTASNGREGLEKAIASKPDLILLDVNMPMMDGHEMLEHLRMNQTLKTTPVVMVTMLSEAHDIATASIHGISDYIVKPFNLVELVDKVSFALGNRVLT